MNFIKLSVFAVIVFAFSACGGEKQAKQEVVEVTEEITEIREDWSVIEVTGTVTEINKETRQITLLGSEGNLVSTTVGEAVERFDEIVVGDQITFGNVVYLMAEFRDPTPEEIAEPLVILADVAKAPEDLAPAGAIGSMIKAVVTIEALNRPFMLATVQGPGGNFLTIPMKDAEFIKELTIGQVLILTYAEATAVSLTKL